MRLGKGFDLMPEIKRPRRRAMHKQKHFALAFIDVVHLFLAY
jgi:hypothetical protein